MLFVAANEDDETLAGCNDVAWLKAGIVHCTVRGFLFLPIWRWWNRGLRSSICDKFLGAQASFLHALLPLLTR